MSDATPSDDGPSEYWEAEIAALERVAGAPGVPRAPIVFAGSSSIRLWPDLEQVMAPLAVVNMGFGGAQMDAVRYYAPRIVLPWRPRAVVLYAGENDLEPHRCKTPEAVLADYVRFANMLAETVPFAKLFVLSIKRSPARCDSWPAIGRLNELLQRFCDDHASRLFVDVATAGLDAGGNPRRELFLEDGLHLSRHGYDLWSSILRPVLASGSFRGGAPTAPC